jgi:uncharacterized double-CXXCG motif protein
VRLFRVHRDVSNSAERFSYDIVAAHTWTLPGVQDCPKCYETWASSVAYPDVDLSRLRGEESYRTQRPQTLYVVHRMREAVKPFVAPGTSLPPGTEFGPLVGHGTGTFGDFGWPQRPGVMLVRPEAAARLGAAGVRGLRTVPAHITYRGGEDPMFREVAFAYEGQIADDELSPGGTPACAACGFCILPSEKRTQLDPASVSGAVDIFRGIDLPSCIYATESFVDAVRSLGLTDIAFEEIAWRRADVEPRVSYRM